jgi:hypothetical protein
VLDRPINSPFNLLKSEISEYPIHIVSDSDSVVQHRYCARLRALGMDVKCYVGRSNNPVADGETTLSLLCADLRDEASGLLLGYLDLPRAFGHLEKPLPFGVMT